MIPDVAYVFSERARQSLGDRLIAIYLVGSFSRDDEGPDSDVDLFVLVNEVDPGLLSHVGSIVQEIQDTREINPAVVSLAELGSRPDLFDVAMVRHDGIALVGELPAGRAYVEDELEMAKRTAKDVLMSSRHYLAVDEPREKFAGGKLWTYVLKPLSFALRLYHYHTTGVYVREFRDLVKEYPVLALDHVRDHQRIIVDSIRLCEEIIRAE